LPVGPPEVSAPTLGFSVLQSISSRTERTTDVSAKPLLVETQSIQYAPNPSRAQTHTFRESNASQSSSDSMNVSKKRPGDPTNMNDVRRAQNKRLVKANPQYLDSEWNRICGRELDLCSERGVFSLSENSISIIK